MSKWSYSDKELNEYFQEDKYGGEEKNSSLIDMNEMSSNGSTNPFAPAIKELLSQIKEIDWSFPYIHSIIALLALLLTVVLLMGLYPTVGVLLQVNGILWTLTGNAYQKMKLASSFEKIGHAASVGFLAAISLPFAIASMPFYLLAQIASGFYSLFD